MSKKNLPNIPIYIGDWERDCNILSLESEMAWMKIIFKLHLSGKQSIYKTSTKALQILWKSTPEKVAEILDELRFNNICEITDITGGYEFLCRRFKKENDISEIRSEAVKTRYKDKPDATNALQNSYKSLQSTDNDNDNDFESEVEVKKEKKEKIDFQQIVNIFNETCRELPAVQKITPKRKTAIEKAITENGLEGITNVFKSVSESKFLNGKSGNDWKADFDWILNPNNLIKIIEGKYRNNTTTPTRSASNFVNPIG